MISISSSPQLLMLLTLCASITSSSCSTLDETYKKPGQKRAVSQAPFKFPIEEVIDDLDDEVDILEQPESDNIKNWRFKNHRVAPGDWLSKLALIYYGDKEKWHIILSANPDINPNLILPGQILKIPEIQK